LIPERLHSRNNGSEEIEQGIGSVGKLKILRLLLSDPSHAFTRYEIGKRIANDPVSIRNDLATLTRLNWITHYKIQHLDKYSINLDHEIVRALSDFFTAVRYLS
jgi:hypothetical protein